MKNTVDKTIEANPNDNARMLAAFIAKTGKNPGEFLAAFKGASIVSDEDFNNIRRARILAQGN